MTPSNPPAPPPPPRATRSFPSRRSEGLQETGTRIELFRDLDFTIASGDFVAIKGASGVGKSTLLHILGMLDHPTSGRVLFKGKDTGGLSDKSLSAIRNGEIGFVFQFHHLLPDLTVRENVLMPNAHRRRPAPRR